MTVRLPLRIVFGCALAAMLAGLTPMRPQDPKTADKSIRLADAKIADLAWIAGRWAVQQGEHEFLEETWNDPMANSMIGMFRWQRGDRIWLYEYLLIEETEEGITYHLRHFGPGSKGWETKDEPLSFPLKNVRENEAIFENPDRNDPKRFIFARDGDTLAIHIESEDEGETKRNTFRYRLAK